MVIDGRAIPVVEDRGTVMLYADDLAALVHAAREANARREWDRILDPLGLGSRDIAQ